jgi:hypothetical protein
MGDSGQYGWLGSRHDRDTDDKADGEFAQQVGFQKCSHGSILRIVFIDLAVNGLAAR